MVVYGTHMYNVHKLKVHNRGRGPVSKNVLFIVFSILPPSLILVDRVEIWPMANSILYPGVGRVGGGGG